MIDKGTRRVDHSLGGGNGDESRGDVETLHRIMDTSIRSCAESALLQELYTMRSLTSASSNTYLISHNGKEQQAHTAGHLSNCGPDTHFDTALLPPLGLL